MDSRLIFFIFITLFSNIFEAVAQQKQPTIKLLNPSFEGPPKQATVPLNWYNCGSPRETEPDTQPGAFGVNKASQNGLSYLGMVVRDNDTRESVSQRLSSPLKVDYCYSFSIWLCHSETYLSKSPTTSLDANYVVPIKLRIYGGNNYCDKAELLAETGEITTSSWLEYKFELKPKKDYNYILLEACHKTPTLIPYNGNILVDNASALVPKYCGRQIAAVNNPRKPQEKPKTLPSSQTGTVASTTPTTTPNNIPRSYDYPTANAYDRKKIKVGQTIGIEKLNFDADSSIIKRECFTVLDELYQFMSANNDISIEIGGHTNDIPPDEFCDRLSTARAKAVADYLMRKGINDERVRYKGYGKRIPLFPNVNATNRKRNQRVEIKILSIG
jgi:outer membrane protein OmpA-like peptidoglycan-associated protein